MYTQALHALKVHRFDSLKPGEIVRPIDDSSLTVAAVITSPSGTRHLLDLDGSRRFCFVTANAGDLFLPVAQSAELHVRFDPESSEQRAWRNRGTLRVQDGEPYLTIGYGASEIALLRLSDWASFDVSKAPIAPGSYLACQHWEIGRMRHDGAFERLFGSLTATGG